jgi:hypothetical protein
MGVHIGKLLKNYQRKETDYFLKYHTNLASMTSPKALKKI